MLRFVTFILFAVVACSHAVNAKPNVLFIAIDDLNDWVGFLDGHPNASTPHMDELAKRGIVFSNAHCAAPLCCPSRAAIFSGQYPFRTGVYDNDDRIRQLRPNLKLLPIHFKENGYKTFGTGKLLHRKFADLFDESFFTEQRWSPFERREVDYTTDELPSKGTANPRHVVPAREGRGEIVLPLNRMPSDRNPENRKGESFDWGPFDIEDDEMGDGKVARWAAEHLKASHDKPFFLAIGFYRPHIPLYAPKKYFEQYAKRPPINPPFLPNDLEDLGPIGKHVALFPQTAGKHETVVKFDEWQKAVEAYLACVSFVDAQIQLLIDALDKGPNSEDTIVMLWSDHGWHLGEKQHWGKWTGWERSTRVPFFVVPTKKRAADFQKGAVCPSAVSLLDMYPTLLELCDVTAPHRLDGESLVDLMITPHKETNRAVVTTFGEDRFAVRDRHFRLVKYGDETEFYDHRTDPNEWHNLANAAKYSTEIQRLEGELKRKLARDISPN